MAVDRDQWSPPQALSRGDGARVAGALGGSLLLEQPRYRATFRDVQAFQSRPGDLVIEVGFDHGITLLANARAYPELNWMGVELRRQRVEAVKRHAPVNCLPLRLDARALFGAVLPANSVARVDVLFPTPATQASHLLWTPHFVEHLQRCLRDGGLVYLKTDVPGLVKLVDTLFAGWEVGYPPPPAPELSRRERVCRRDGVQVWTRAWRRSPRKIVAAET